MEFVKRKSVHDKLSKYDYLSNRNSDDFIEVTEWANGEGYDIDINGKLITLSDDELEAINYLTLVMRFENKNNGWHNCIRLFYGEVYIYTLPRLNMYDSEIETWLGYMDFNLDDISWMVNKNIIINDERK